ncbi:sensor domain-containing diguanylate cyclase [bacterium]|nr:sensor domain-containing diguanylate cyclase [bacterium]
MVNAPEWVFDSLPYGVLLLDAQNYVKRANKEAQRFFGRQAEVGGHFSQRLPAGQHRLPSPEAGSAGLVAEVLEGPPGSELWLYVFREDSQVAWVSEDTERMAFEDPLTGLPNWNILSQFVDHSCSQSQRYQRSSALLRVDLDHLRQVNNDLGRTGGDEVLVQAAQRLQNLVRSSDIVGRLEGDKFLILLTELTADRGVRSSETGHLPVRARAAVVAMRLNAAFRQPFIVGEAQVACPVSIGVAVCPEDAILPGEWVEAAELALQHSKEAGGDSHELYAEALKQQHELKKDRHRQMEEALRDGGLAFRWLPVMGPEPLEHYWWQWPAQSIDGPEVPDWIDSAGLHGPWGKWQKAYLESQKGQCDRLAPLPSVWLNPGVDTGFLLQPGWIWEVDEVVLHHRYRLQSLLQLQDKGLKWILSCSSRGLQNLSLLGKLQPKMMKFPLPPKPTFEHERLLMASAQVAEAFGIELLVCLDQDSEPRQLMSKLSPRWMLRTP